MPSEDQVNPHSMTELEEPLLLQEDVSPNPTTEPARRLYDGLECWETSVLIKALYFLDALGASAWGRFSAIYYNLHGLNPQHIGMIEGLRTALPTLSQVLWGIVADKFQSRKKVWILTNTMSTLILLTLALPVVYTSFTKILVVSIGSSLFVSSGILDAFTLDVLGSANKMYYGRYRLYASLSWGFGSIVMGWITDHYHNFEPNFILFGILALVMVALVAWKIPNVTTTTATTVDVTPPTPSTRTTTTTATATTTESIDENNDNHTPSDSHAPLLESQSDPPPPPRQDQGEEEDPHRHHHLMELVCLAARPQVALFLSEVIIMGAAMATVERLLFLYLVNDLQASTLLCGLSVGVNVLFELPIFWHAETVMKTLGGHDGMYLVAMLCFFVRVVGYTWLTPATRCYILLLEVLHGITFACFWIASMDISKGLVHQTKGAFWRTAIPSSVQMLYAAVGVSLGSILGGWAMHKYGSRTMYKCTAGIVAVTFCIHLVGSIVSRVFWNGASFLPDYSNHEHESSDNDDDGEEEGQGLVDHREEGDYHDEATR